MTSLVLLFLALIGGLSRATVIQMDLNECVTPRHQVLAALSGAADTEKGVCTEYLLASSTVAFRVQAKTSQVLIAPGETVSFFSRKGKMYLQRDDNGAKVETTVTCMRSVTEQGDLCGLKPEMVPSGQKQAPAAAGKIISATESRNSD